MLTRILGLAVTTFLVVAALAIAFWFIFANSTGATLVVFRTGSMSPAMPQGSLAFSMPVTAKEIEVGDVITVQRDRASLPVTHRVVEIRDQNTAQTAEILPAEAREIVMQGDANNSVDMLPYVVQDARRAVFAIPQAGAAVMILQSPLGMGVLVIMAGMLTVWAFWPGPGTQQIRGRYAQIQVRGRYAQLEVRGRYALREIK